MLKTAERIRHAFVRHYPDFSLNFEKNILTALQALNTELAAGFQLHKTIITKGDLGEEETERMGIFTERLLEAYFSYSERLGYLSSLLCKKGVLVRPSFNRQHKLLKQARGKRLKVNKIKYSDGEFEEHPGASLGPFLGQCLYIEIQFFDRDDQCIYRDSLQAFMGAVCSSSRHTLRKFEKALKGPRTRFF